MMEPNHLEAVNDLLTHYTDQEIAQTLRTLCEDRARDAYATARVLQHTRTRRATRAKPCIRWASRARVWLRAFEAAEIVQRGNGK